MILFYNIPIVKYNDTFIFQFNANQIVKYVIDIPAINIINNINVIF